MTTIWRCRVGSFDCGRCDACGLEVVVKTDPADDKVMITSTQDWDHVETSLLLDLSRREHR